MTPLQTVPYAQRCICGVWLPRGATARWVWPLTSGGKGHWTDCYICRKHKPVVMAAPAKE